ncbi:hypothetical protein PMAC_001862 [Pneumocystis sp. 'macacae']|nr:hypothetical protein PMAC_001862 [Pneumocystis sp. 'macacae']
MINNTVTTNTVATGNVSTSKTPGYISSKCIRNVKDLSLPTIRLDTSPTLTPLNTPRAHLLANLRTTSCLDKQGHVYEGQKNEKIHNLSQNICKEDALNLKQRRAPMYPHTATLSPNTTRGLGLPLHKESTVLMNSVSEPSTPYQPYFEEPKRMSQEKYHQFLYDDPSFVPYMSSQQYLCFQKQMKNMIPALPNTFVKGVIPYHTQDQHVFSYSPMMHDSFVRSFSGYSIPIEFQNHTIKDPTSSHCFQNFPQNYNSFKKNRHGQIFNGCTSNSNLVTGYHGNTSSPTREGAPCRQPRGPPSMEELLSPNEFENKNFSLRLRKQAINKILHAGVQRQNNLLPPDPAVQKNCASNASSVL